MSQVNTAALASGARGAIDAAIGRGDFSNAAAALAELWRAEPGSATAAFVVSRFEQARGTLALLPHRLAILRSFTVEPIVPLLRASAFAAGIDLTVHVGAFNAYVQEFVDDGSALYRCDPSTVILALDARDVVPRLWTGFPDLTAAEVKQEIEDALGRYRNCVDAFRRRSGANLIVHLLARPAVAAHGILDAQLETGQADAFAAINRGLREMARAERGVYVLDYDEVVGRYGRAHWTDERKWLTVRLPFSPATMLRLTKEWMRFLHPLSGRIAKAVAVDLDNTLWGGVIGEDGINGIRLGRDYPGAAYLEVQRVLLDLRRRGILLTICSKNNPADALEALQNHPEMLLKPEHFAATRINWNDKASNLRELAEELRIGVDSIAFVDDNPVERQHVRNAAPEVMVVDLPDEPMEFPRALRDAPVFERLALSAEDIDRGEMYRVQQERRTLEARVGSREDFFRSLEQELEMGRVSAATVARVAQLTQKTNQFNLMTRRYTEQQIGDMAARSDWRVYWIRVRDRFGDNGLVGVAIVRTAGAVWEIDTFLMSCRVIGRTVETAFLSQLAEEAVAAGAKRLDGWFLPTKKNAPAASFYPDHGFTEAETTDEGARWTLDLETARPPRPEWIRLFSSYEFK